METNYLESLNEFIWNPSFWLPKNRTWDELKKQSSSDFDSLITIPLIMAVVIYIIRLCFER